MRIDSFFHSLSLSLLSSFSRSVREYVLKTGSYSNRVLFTENRQPSIQYLDNTDIFDIETDRSRASISYRFARLCDLSSLPATSRLLTLELANLSRQPGERKWRVIRVKFKLCRVIFGITPLEGTDARNKLETYTFLLNEGFFL